MVMEKSHMDIAVSDGILHSLLGYTHLICYTFYTLLTWRLLASTASEPPTRLARIEMNEFINYCLMCAFFVYLVHSYKIVQVNMTP